MWYGAGLDYILKGSVAADFYVGILGLIMLMYGVFKGESSFKKLAYGSAIALLAILPALHFSQNFGEEVFFTKFANSLRLLVLFLTAVVLIMLASLEYYKGYRFELIPLVLFAALGSMMMLSSATFITFYVALELQALSLYILAASDRDNPFSSEAGLKYFILSAVASGIMLYGISLVYAFTGTVKFEVLKSLVSNEFIDITSLPSAIMVGIVMVVIGFFFKLSLAPFHMWTPDVYEGSPTIFTAFFASVPKIAAIGVLIKIFDMYLTKWLPSMQSIFMLVAVISMFIGALGAIKQTKIKRLMAYSSISHMGFLIMALLNYNSVKIVTQIYVLIYSITVLGAFAVIIAVERNYNIDNIRDLSGLSKIAPYHALILAITMFSMAGIPPLAGFFAKLMILESLIASNHTIIAVIAVISSVISAYYYLNIVKVMYFDEAKHVLQMRMNIGNTLVASFAGAYNLVYMLFHSSFVAYFNTLRL